MFATLSDAVPKVAGAPERTHTLEVYRRFLNGTIYDVLKTEFHNERNNAGEYIPLRQRRPSVRYGLCRVIVDDSIGFLFGEGRFPAVECAEKEDQERLASILDDAKASEVFAEAAMIGSVGSVAVRFRLLKDRVFLDPMATDFLTPDYDPERPDTLRSVTEAYQVRGDTLRAAGYTIPDRSLPASFWFRREWTKQDETWFLPQPLEDSDKGFPPIPDGARSVHHGLGFVPIVWIKNLPGGTGLDGDCTFRPAVDASIEIDYQLSQGGRGLKYASDPTLLIKEPAAAEYGEIVRSAGNALVVSEKGDARLLEINGTASAAVIEYVKALRELALESVHGNRSNADRLGASQSGRAMELLYAPLLVLVDRLRAGYGRGILAIAKMVATVATRSGVLVEDDNIKLGKIGRLTLRWPPFFLPTHEDMLAEATTLGLLRRGGMMSSDTAVRRTAATYDVGDVDEELLRIKADQAKADARAAQKGAQVQDKQTLDA